MGERDSAGIYPALKSSDRAVLRHLLERARAGNGDTCTASIPRIANACDISERQVQISTRRLIDARLIERLGYDFSNPDRSKRGTVYRVQHLHPRARPGNEREGKKKSVKLILLWSED
jgi:DNA-binding Lrp family transcriptional regulator